MSVLAIYAEDYPWDVRVDKILTGISGLGLDVDLVCRNLERNPRTERHGDWTLHRVVGPDWGGPLGPIGSTPAPFSPVWRARVRDLIQEKRPGLIFVRDLPLAPLAVDEGRRADIPVIVDLAENHPAMWRDGLNPEHPLGGRIKSYLFKNPRVLEAYEPGVARGADAVFVVVEEMREHLERLGARRVVLVSNTPPAAILDGERADPTRGGHDLDLGYVGYVSRVRGLQTIVRGIAALGERGPRVRLHVVGTGDYIDTLKAQTLSLGVEDRVLFHGWMDNAKVPDFLAQTCNVGVVPHIPTDHTNSTVPNKIFDAMAVGLPVLVSDAHPLRRIVEDEQCGTWFETASTPSLVDAFERLSDPSNRRAMSARGPEAVRRSYHWEQDLERALEVVRELHGGVAAHHG